VYRQRKFNPPSYRNAFDDDALERRPYLKFSKQSAIY